MWELPTGLICADILPRYLILLCHLVLQMSFSLLQHIKLLPQIEDSFLGRISPRLRRLPSKPGSPHREDGMCAVYARLKAQSAILFTGV